MQASSALFGLLLAGIVLGQHSFVPGKQYEFLYEGRVASGLVGVSPQFAGLGIKATILCTTKDPKSMVVQIKKPVVGKLNDRLRSEEAFYKEELPISYRPIEQLGRELQNPFIVTIKSGLVTSIRTEEGEPTVIKNIKRSIASTLQININGLDRFTQPTELLLPAAEDNSQKTTFTVMEASIMGVCETLYTLSPLPEYLALVQEKDVPSELKQISPESHFVVTKTVNLKNCLQKASFQHVSPVSDECKLSNDNCKSSQSRTSFTRYLLEGNRNSYVLKSLWSEGDTVLRVDEADLKVFSHQTLHLQSITRARPPRTRASSTTSLLFDIPTMTPGVRRLDEKTLLETPIFPLHTEILDEVSVYDVLSKVQHLLEEISTDLVEPGHPEETAIPTKVLTIVKGIQMLNYQDLKLVTNQVLDGRRSRVSNFTSSETKTQIYMDCLALAGTNPSVLVIKDLLSLGILEGEQAAEVLMTIPMTLAIPIPRIIEELIDIARLRGVRTDPQVYSSALLALSHVTYKACINQNISRSAYPVHLFNGEICNSNSRVVESVLILLEQSLVTANTPFERDVVIKALGNLAHPKSLVALKPYILGSEEMKNVQTRTEAILSLERLAKMLPKEVRQLLLSILSNPMDHYEPRITAFTMLLETNPPSAVFQQIALMTWFEPSDQLNSYIWSTFNSLTSLSYPTETANELAKKSQMVLPMTKPMEEDLFDSTTDHFNNYVGKMDVASLLHVTTIRSKESIVPSVIYKKLYSSLFGYEYSPLQATFYSQGTQTLINKLLLPQTTKHPPSLVQYWKEVGPEILNRINMNSETSDSPRGKIHVKLYDAMERMFSFDESNTLIRELLQENTLNLEALTGEREINYQKILPQNDYLSTFPTLLGFPVVISARMPVVISVKGSLQAQMSPSKITGGTLLNNDPPVSVEVTAEFHPLISVQRLTTASIVTTFFKEKFVSGIEQHTEISLPGRLTLSFDSSTYTLKTNFLPAQQSSDVHVAYHHVKPFTTVYNPTELEPMTLSQEYRIIHKPVHLKQRSIELGQQYFGLDIVAELKTEENIFGFLDFNELLKQHTPLSALNFLYTLPRPVCYQKMGIVFKPSTSETEAINVTFEYKNYMLVNSTMVPIQFSNNSSTSHNTNITDNTNNSTVSNTTEVDTSSNSTSNTDFSNDYNSTDDTPLDEEIFNSTTNDEMLHKALSMQKPKRMSLRSSGLPISPAYKHVSFSNVINQTLYITVEFQGNSSRLYTAMFSMSNYSTSEVYTKNMTMGFRVEKLPSGSPSAYYAESVLQVPLVKTQNLTEILKNPINATFSTNITISNETTIQVRVKMIRDEKQHNFAKESPEFKMCKENQKHGMPYSYNCTVAKVHATSLNNFTIEMATLGSKVPSYLSKTFSSIENLVEYLYYPFMYLDPTTNSTSPADVEVYLRKKPYRKSWDVELKKPHETSRFYDVPVSNDLFKYFLPSNLVVEQQVIFPRPLDAQHIYPVCIAQSRSLKTFDNVTVPLTMVSSECWHLLLKDCTGQTALEVQARPSPNGKEVKVILGEHDVHILPSKNGTQVTINDEEISLSPDTFTSPVFEYKGKKVVVKVRLLPSGMIEIDSPLYMVKVYHDGQNALVEPSNLYRGRLCGLCGDLDGEATADLKTPEMCVLDTTDDKEFFASWIVPEDSCRPYEIPEQQCYRNRYLPTGQLSSSDPSDGEDDSTESEPGYEMKEVIIPGPHHSECYSLERVKVCKPGYTASSYHPQKVGFFCVPEGVRVPLNRRRMHHIEHFRRVPVECVPV